MDCSNLRNDDPLWLPCIDPPISTTPICQNLPPNLFDIEILDNQNNPVRPPFEGSSTGTTVQNLQLDSFRVNEIVHEDTNHNQLARDTLLDLQCKGLGFSGGGSLFNTNTEIFYQICFQYKDEQNNNCNPITLGAGEEKTCTVRNHIIFAVQT